MNKFILIGIFMMSQCVFADDYSEGRQFALDAQSAAVSGIKNFNPGDYLNDYTDNPNETRIDQNNLKEEAIKEAARNETAQEIVRPREKESIDSNSAEMLESGQAIDQADAIANGANLPCADGKCLPTLDENGEDFSEGASRLGVLVSSAKEVSDKQINSGNAAIFAGVNWQCRIAVAGIGNCCGGHARFLNCHAEEKALAVAITEGRADQIGAGGRYCAVRKMGICWEEKESWCVFPSKLAEIFQKQGRWGQLGIDFGWARGGTNAPNCRGITPEQLERINFQNLNLSSVSKEFESRHLTMDPQKVDSDAAAKIEAMKRGGSANG